MKKIIATLFLFLHVCYGNNILEEINECSVYFESGVVLKSIPAATTNKKREKGLSMLEDVGVGMIFIFDKPKQLSFWMKDTLVDLEIAFFDSKGILHQIEEMKSLSLKTHNSKKPSRVAIEVKKGDFRKLNIKLGDRIKKLDCN